MVTWANLSRWRGGVFVNTEIYDNKRYLYELTVDIPERLGPEDNYIRDIPAIKHLQSPHAMAFSAVTFLVGENGTGKSTLLEGIALACGFNAEGGTINFNFNTRKSHSSLYKFLKIARNPLLPCDGFFLRAESFFNVATNIEALDEVPAASPYIMNSYGHTPLHEQSHGESFMALVMNRFGGKGLYILDEPEAALSPTRQLALMSKIHQLVKDDSQFIIATHSPILLGFPGASIFELREDGITKTDYDKTEHYMITKNYLNNPERINKLIFEEE